jgi:hypothetical protein
VSDIISSRWCTMCIQPEYACGCADPKLEASVAEKIEAGVPMAQAIAELVELRSAKPREALRPSVLCSSCREPLDEETEVIGREMCFDCYCVAQHRNPELKVS